MSPPLLGRVRHWIARERLLAPGDRVLLALSGGADSTALLFFFDEVLKPLYGLTVAAAHLDHGLRGRESDTDRRFVQALCRRRRIRCFTKKIRLRKTKGASLEALARQVRYRFLNGTARRRGFSKIATAHHLDDQAETVLMRILRGTGPRGLAGILPKMGRVIRPFLCVKRAELENFLKSRRQGWREDRMNRDPAFLRTRVRRRLLPYLTGHFGLSVGERLARLAHNAFMERGEGGTAKAAFDALLKPHVKGPLNAREWAALKAVAIDGTRRAVNLPKGVRVEREPGRIVFRLPEPRRPGSPPLTFPKRAGAFGKNQRIRLSFLTRPKRLKYPAARAPRAMFDAGTLAPQLIFRRPRAGDRFFPLGSPGRMKLSDFLINQKVPRSERERLWLLESGGRIAWVAGHRIGEPFKVRRETRKIVVIETAK